MKKLLFTFILLISTILSCNAEYHCSEIGKAFIKKYENLSLTAYPDSKGYSIGYGHHSSDVYEGMIITSEQAEELFNKDIQRIEKSVNRLLNALPYKYTFSQSFIDGFISFVYNTGEGGAKQSTFYQHLMRCRVRNGVMDLSDYNYTLSKLKISRISCDSHIRRREAEYRLMLG